MLCIQQNPLIFQIAGPAAFHPGSAPESSGLGCPVCFLSVLTTTSYTTDFILAPFVSVCVCTKYILSDVKVGLVQAKTVIL